MGLYWILYLVIVGGVLYYCAKQRGALYSNLQANLDAMDRADKLKKPRTFDDMYMAYLDHKAKNPHLYE